jgi:hypothetical protein
LYFDPQFSHILPDLVITAFLIAAEMVLEFVIGFDFLDPSEAIFFLIVAAASVMACPMISSVL